MWRKYLLKLSDDHAAIRKRKIRNTHSPWLTPVLNKLMFDRYKIKRIATNYKTLEDWSKI